MSKHDCRKVSIKNQCEIADEWDNICIARQAAIDDEKDISLKAVTAPCIIKNLNKVHAKSVLDVGCGTGYLSYEIGKIAEYCCGIDISKRSIEIANKKYSRENVEYVNTAISRFIPARGFDCCVANMVFMSDTDWKNSIKQIHNILEPLGSFLVMITHPCFWPRYWKFDAEQWFCQNKEIYIESNFSISLAKEMGISTYIHRPLQEYVNSLIDVGFSIEGIDEPYPVTSTPEGYEYKEPRFLFILCRKKEN